MLHRPSLRATVTTLAAAAVLVGGADLASYAASGHPLILGHKNSAVGTTSLKNAGRGPALSLNSAKSAPPLVVNSKKMVKHLNANMVGGQSAKQLDPPVWRYHLGSPNGTLTPNGEHLFTTSVPKGTYQMQISGVVESDTSTDSFDCVIANKDKILAMDQSGIYAAYVGDFTNDANAPFVNAADVETFGAKTTLLFGCETGAASGVVKTVRPVTFTLRQVPVFNKTGTVFTITPKHGAPKSLLRR